MPTKLPKYVGVHELYLGYSYLWRDINSTSIYKPYVSVDKISDHPHALDITSWRKIVDCYLDTLFDNMLEGRGIHLPHHMGHMELRKCKSSYRRKFITTPTGEKKQKVFMDRKTGGYSIMMVWSRRRYCNMPYKFIYRLRLTKYRWRQIWGKVLKDTSKIYNLRDVDPTYTWRT